MIFLLKILFWFSVMLLLHSYFIYPFLMKIIARSKKMNQNIFALHQLPKVAIVIAAFNEEKVIEEKIIKTLKTNYPIHLITLFIGSDNSTDKTNAIIEKYANQYQNIVFKNFIERSGKQEVLNKLFEHYISKNEYEVCIMTDANILFTENTIYELVKHFKNEQIGIVCGNIKNKNIKSSGISKQEQFYILNENELKINEGLVFGSSIAAFGACYAIKRALVPLIPKNILMEDFYISMHVLKNHFQVVTEPLAICYEDLPQKINEEFKRKKRISTGNFQNLVYYYPLLYRGKFGIAFPFFSHKIIRWFGPFILIALYLSLWFLFKEPLYLYTFLGVHVFLTLASLDYILKAININVNLLRLMRYFLLMNAALFLGFFIYMKGVKTNIWQPTKRNE